MSFFTAHGVRPLRRAALAAVLALAPCAAFAATYDAGCAQEDAVLARAKALVNKGLNAGTGYSEVWIRDLNTFIDLKLAASPDHAPVREALLNFFRFQQANGGILDGYTPRVGATMPYDFYKSPLAPAYYGHKNTVETDQESSLIQAVAKYVAATGDAALLREAVGGITVADRLGQAVAFLREHRTDARTGLLWGGTTADWGDVQPETDWGVTIGKGSHRAIDIYDNAMFVLALDRLAALPGTAPARASEYRELAAHIRNQARLLLWDTRAAKFRPHLYLEGSPFPPSLNEADIYFLGGTAVAVEAGILTRAEVLASYREMQRRVRAAGAASVGLTIYPPYPASTFKNPQMVPYGYQNGGDWTWFGARLVSDLARYGYVAEAREALAPMVARVVANNGFYEWYSRENKPQGSGDFRGEAGVLWTAIRAVRAAAGPSTCATTAR